MDSGQLNLLADGVLPHAISCELEELLQILHHSKENKELNILPEQKFSPLHLAGVESTSTPHCGFRFQI